MHTLTKCTLQDRFLFSHFTKKLQSEEKKEYVDIFSNVGLNVERSIWIILRLHFWSLVTDCGFVLRTAFRSKTANLVFHCVGRNLLHLLSSLHPQYGGQKAIDTHRYKLLQLLLSGDATPLYAVPLTSTCHLQIFHLTKLRAFSSLN